MIKLKSLGLSLIVASVILGNSVLASVPTPVLNESTDIVFRLIHPEMRGRDIQSHQTQYQKEWLAIREAMRDQFVSRPANDQ